MKKIGLLCYFISQSYGFKISKSPRIEDSFDSVDNYPYFNYKYLKSPEDRVHEEPKKTYNQY